MAAQVTSVFMYVDDVVKSLEFYNEIVGAEIAQIHAEKEGAPISLAILRIGDFTLMLHPQEPHAAEFADTRVGVGIHLQLRVDDVDAFYQHCLDEGAHPQRLRRADRPDLGLARVRPQGPRRLRLVDLPGQVGRSVDLIGSGQRMHRSGRRRRFAAPSGSSTGSRSRRPAGRRRNSRFIVAGGERQGDPAPRSRPRRRGRRRSRARSGRRCWPFRQYSITPSRPTGHIRAKSDVPVAVLMRHPKRMTRAGTITRPPPIPNIPLRMPATNPSTSTSTTAVVSFIRPSPLGVRDPSSARASNRADAVSAAVSIRRMVGPRPTTCQPSAFPSSTSASLKPPSGPIARTHEAPNPGLGHAVNGCPPG